MAKYVMRYAAGTYWLLDIEQSGQPYHPPLTMNELGAEIWTMLSRGESTEQIIESLTREYEQPRERVNEDVALFVQTLKEQGILKEQRSE